MSLYALQKFMFDINRGPDEQARYLAGEGARANLLEQYVSPTFS